MVITDLVVHRIERICHTGVVGRGIESVRLRTVGDRLPIDAAPVERRTDEGLLPDRRKPDGLVRNSFSPLHVDTHDHVLVARLSRPEEISGGRVQRPDDARFAWDAGDHLASATRSDVGIQPRDSVGVRRHLGLYQDALEGVILVPIVSWKVLEVPLDLAGIGVEGQRGVGVENIASACVSLKRSPRDGHRHADIDQVQLRIVTRGNPGGASPALLVRKGPPGLASGLSSLGDGAGAPQLLARLQVVGRDPTSRVDVVTAGHARDDLTLDDHRPAGVVLADRPITDLMLPYHLSRASIEGDQEGVVRGNDEMVSV